ncbi:hypothetical protein Psi02_77000 [Planotetraspora silvatica]|uniref:Uncharacterized protein n=1 Tax=Planotetraspora silvatica TaxID=234614 RepID=A0A8J3XT72_9ACTN|nr:hypothetical protein [Planotetraspora silvatica]GII51276.1 hypothetical protein Psi02_77000 [Planotetraspora silvatica]
MSEFLLPKIHIDALLTAALAWEGEEYARYRFDRRSAENPAVLERVVLSLETADDLGRILWGQNFDMAAWYVGFELDTLDAERVAALDKEALADLHSVQSYAFDRLPGEPDPGVILWAIACYEYQTCPEFPEEWIGTPAAPFISYLQGRARSRLPGAQVAWPIEDRDIFLTWASQ